MTKPTMTIKLIMLLPSHLDTGLALQKKLHLQGNHLTKCTFTEIQEVTPSFKTLN